MRMIRLQVTSPSMKHTEVTELASLQRSSRRTNVADALAARIKQDPVAVALGGAHHDR